MAKIKFVLSEGTVREERAGDGQSVMEAARAAGIAGIVAECGGSLSCATCHVYVGQDWVAALPAVTEAEQDLLDGVPDIRPESRLSCQIFMNEALDGMVIEVPESQF